MQYNLLVDEGAAQQFNERGRIVVQLFSVNKVNYQGAVSLEFDKASVLKYAQIA